MIELESQIIQLKNDVYQYLGLDPTSEYDDEFFYNKFNKVISHEYLLIVYAARGYIPPNINTFRDLSEYASNPNFRSIIPETHHITLKEYDDFLLKSFINELHFIKVY